MAKAGQMVDSLRGCERHMRVEIAQAAAAADPGRLTQLVGWLADIQRILGEADSGVGGATAGEATSPLNAGKLPPDVPATILSKRQPNRYPQFFREGDSLVKVGWSKKSREEYEHKAPKAAVLAIASVLAEAGRSKRRITMEKVMPVRNPALNSDIPDYQVYIALAWLRELDLVVQHGRQGYTLGCDGELQQLMSKAWDSLAEK